MNTERSISVLVVDDEHDNAANLADILEDIGYRVDVATDGTSALKLLESNVYTFALLDFQMPGMNGAELYEEIKKVQPCLVAMMVTAYAGTDGVAHAQEIGTWKVLRKPVDLEELLGHLGTAAEQPLVLLVDDDPDFSKNAWEVLRENGFRVCTAAGENEAIRRMKQMKFDILLLDLKLGREESAENIFYAAQDIDRPELEPPTATDDTEIPHQPDRFLVTGYAGDRRETIEKMIRDGANGVFHKPVDLGQMLDQLKKSRTESEDSQS